MPPLRKSPLKAAGKNDVWFALFFIAAIIVAALIPRHDDAGQTDRPAPVPAAQIKE
ncbi:hypothetical protein [Brevundimonas sp.]|uniref:hypothetical protein n=1 Tax=Brevundimonas sp. TaxID=1871086 RepID=UPI003D129D8E